MPSSRGRPSSSKRKIAINGLPPPCRSLRVGPSMTTARAATDVLIARQPVYDPALRVVGYELLVQHRDGSSAAEEADTSSTISEIGLNLVVGHPAYIPVSRAFLLEGYATALPAERVVLEIGPELTIDRAAQSTIEELVAGGFQLALVDLQPGSDAEKLLPFAHVIGLDLRAEDRGVLRAETARLRKYGATLLARGVEDHADLEFCQELGFDL